MFRVAVPYLLFATVAATSCGGEVREGAPVPRGTSYAPPVVASTAIAPAAKKAAPAVSTKSREIAKQPPKARIRRENTKRLRVSAQRRARRPARPKVAPRPQSGGVIGPQVAKKTPASPSVIPQKPTKRAKPNASRPAKAVNDKAPRLAASARPLPPQGPPEWVPERVVVPSDLSSFW